MNLKEVTDRKGRKYLWDEYDGQGQFDIHLRKVLKAGMKEKVQEVRTLELREDDVMVCAYPKTGTNWLWEIVSMVLKGKPEYESYLKMAVMFDIMSTEFLDTLPSPRVLNTHLYTSYLPEQILTKKIKIIHVIRHPKDIAVSFFYHMKSICWTFDDPPFETFSEFLPYMTGEYGVYLNVSLFRYWLEMEKFAEAHKDLVLELRFEEMKEDLTAAVAKVAKFLNKDLSQEIIEAIAEKCSFNNLKTAHVQKVVPIDPNSRFTAEDLEQLKKHGNIPFLRKGQVGDWKTHFTVAESEQFDRLLEKYLTGNKYMNFYF